MFDFLNRGTSTITKEIVIEKPVIKEVIKEVEKPVIKKIIKEIEKLIYIEKDCLPCPDCDEKKQSM